MTGYAEIADMLGITRQRVDQLVHRPDLPAPASETRHRPLMLKTAVTE